MSKIDNKSTLTEKQKVFCREYIFDYNGSRAYKAAYKGVSDAAARANSSMLLTKTNILEYIKQLQSNLSELSGISPLKVLKEYEKIAFSSISNLHLTWVARKEFEELTEDQKSCIQEIDTKVIKKNIGSNEEPQIVDVEYIKLKLHDKLKGLEGIRKMLGFDAAEKVENKIITDISEAKITFR